MGAFAWMNAAVFDGPLELSCSAKSATVNVASNPLDTTALCTTGWSTFIGGLMSGTFDMELMQDMSAVDAGLWPSVGTADVPMSLVSNAADGSVAYTMRSLNSSYTALDGEVGTLATARLSGVSSSGPVVRGLLLHPTAVARTTSASGVARQMGVVPAGKSIHAALHVVAVSGTTPSLTVKVQSDDNGAFTTPVDRVTFNAATGASSQFSTAVGPFTDDYWRIIWTIAGTAPSFTFAVVAGIA